MGGDGDGGRGGGGGMGKCCTVPEVIAAHDQGIRMLVLSLVVNKIEGVAYL